MMWKTHIVSSVAALGAAQVVSEKLSTPSVASITTSPEHSLIVTYLLVTAGVIIGSTLPDVDLHVKRRHRTFTHTLWFIALMGFLWWKVHTNSTIPFHSVVNPVLFGNLIGTAFHCIEDAYSKMGIAWLWPLQQYITYPNGAKVLKGPRPLTPPIYRVGSKFLGISGLVWWTLIAVPVYIYSLYTLF